MKKLLIIILAVAVIAFVGVKFIGGDEAVNFVSESIDGLFAPKLEKAIVGSWVSENNLTCTFREDGSWSGNIVGLDAVSLNGTYTVDSENSKLTLTYTALGASVSKELDVSIEEDVLKITTKSWFSGESISALYTRQVEE